MAETGHVAGVDGCKGGWIAVIVPETGPLEAIALVTARFADILDHGLRPKIVAVDMPIGLPDFIGPNGRGPEKAARRHLGARQSSVFAVPSRASVFTSDYREACSVAATSSSPPRKVSRQCYGLFPKIREIDALMTPALEERVFEVHPELAFWRLNGEQPMSLPKTIRSEASWPGVDQRRRLLEAHGFDPAFLAAVPRGAAPDDLVDAAASAWIARRIRSGEAHPFPEEPERDGRGLRMAIWA
jgi:predicted RNase H-like nuclease